MKLDVFYPIVPNCAWLARLAPLGIKTVQLRLKDVEPAEISREVVMAVRLAATYNIGLIVNDYWQDAIEAGAAAVHLGQEDLASADLAAIKQANLKLGISTHSEEELEIALSAEPDYVALGPVFETKLKARVSLVKGNSGRTKVIRVDGLSAAEIEALLA